MLRRWTVCLATGLSLLPSITFLIMEASAVECQDHIEQFFVENLTDRQYINGTTGKISLEPRPLDQDCTGPLALSTAHINRAMNGYIENYLVEVGWRKRPATPNFVIFAEKCAGAMCDVELVSAPDLQVNTFDLWRVVNNPASGGTTKWELKADLLEGRGWGDVKSYTTDYHHGEAYGETEAFGNDTGLHDLQRALQHKNNDGNWVDWNDHICIRDWSPSHEYFRNSDTSFDIDGGSQYC
jgi:hypothetical protein